MTREELEIFIDYLITHRTEDFPENETLEDIKKKAKEWKEKNETIE